jgi:hypothetical protein
MDVIQCPHCASVISWVNSKIAFRDECPQCAGDLHCCKTCRFHDVYTENGCRESSADPVNDFLKRNLCDYHVPTFSIAQKSKTEDVKKKLEELFRSAEDKNKSEPSMPTGTTPVVSMADELQEFLRRKKTL